MNLKKILLNTTKCPDILNGWFGPVYQITEPELIIQWPCNKRYFPNELALDLSRTESIDRVTRYIANFCKLKIKVSGPNFSYNYDEDAWYIENEDYFRYYFVSNKSNNVCSFIMNEFTGIIGHLVIEELKDVMNPFKALKIIAESLHRELSN